MWPPLASAQALKDVPAHREKVTVDLLSPETSAFIPPILWPPNIIDFPNLGITYNGGWCTATMTR